jgi:hypothetical protein
LPDWSQVRNQVQAGWWKCSIHPATPTSVLLFSILDAKCTTWHSCSAHSRLGLGEHAGQFHLGS